MWRSTHPNGREKLSNDDENERSKRSLNLGELLKRREVQLSEERVYVSAIPLSKISKLEELSKSGQLQATGQEIVATSTYWSDDHKVEDNVDRSFMERLMEANKLEDLKVLCSAIASVNGCDLPAGNPLEALANAVQGKLIEATKSIAQMMSKISPLISKASESALGISMSKMAEISRQLQDLSAFSVLKAAGQNGLKVDTNIAKELHSSFPNSVIEVPHPIRLPSIEDGPIGRSARATEETAKLVGNLAKLQAEMTREIYTISNTVTLEILPSWQRSLAEGQAEATRTMDQAERSVGWTKWAFFGSIVVSIATCAIQYNQSADFNKGNDAQQAKVMEIMRQQLKASADAQAQLAKDAELLRKQLKLLETKQVR